MLSSEQFYPIQSNFSIHQSFRALMKKLILLLSLLATPLQAEIYTIDQLKLDNYRGKVVYLDFWASWCKPCVNSFPWMNSLVEKYASRPFVVVTINLDQEAQAMHDFLARVGADFDIFHDPDGRLAEQFQLEAMPTSYLIDVDGVVVKKHIGFYTQDLEKYQQEIEALL